MRRYLQGTDFATAFAIGSKTGFGVSIAASDGTQTETACSGSGRFGQDFPISPDMLFQAGSVSKPAFAMTLLRFADRGDIDLDADLSGVLSDFVSTTLTDDFCITGMVNRDDETAYKQLWETLNPIFSGHFSPEQ